MWNLEDQNHSRKSKAALAMDGVRFQWSIQEPIPDNVVLGKYDVIGGLDVSVQRLCQSVMGFLRQQGDLLISVVRS